MTAELGQNALVIRVQPDEGVTLRFGSKVPGSSMEVRDVNMDFSYASAASSGLSSRFFSSYFTPLRWRKVLTILHGAHVVRVYTVTGIAFSFWGNRPPYPWKEWGEASLPPYIS